MKSKLVCITAALSLIGLSGCSVKSSDEFTTEEIEAIFEIYISDKKDAIESHVKIEAVLKATGSGGDISAVSLSEEDSLKVIYKDIEHNVIENYMALGLYSTNFLASVSDNDSLDIELIHDEDSVNSSIEFDVLPELTSEEEVSLSINDSVSLSWINNSAKINRINFSGPCYRYHQVDLEPEETSYTINLTELEFNNFEACIGEVELEWKILGSLNPKFEKGEVTAYITKGVILNIE